MDDDEQGAPRAARPEDPDGPDRAGPAEAIAPRGWYPDPWSRAPFRWWDGRVWTAEVSDVGPEPPAAWVRSVGQADVRGRVN